jgi:CrcB protein
MDAGYVAAGAVVGALARHHINRKGAVHGWLPWSTAGINIAGSFILGVITANTASLPPRQRLLFGTGFCGAFTTFSTFSVDVVNLIENKQMGKAALYVVASNTLSIGAAFVGYRYGPRLKSIILKQ